MVRDQRCLGIRQVVLGLLDFSRLAGFLEVGQLPRGLGEHVRGLVARRPIVRVVLGKQRRSGRDLVATRHENRGEQPLLRWTDHDEIGLRIALPDDGGGARVNHHQMPPPARRSSRQRSGY